MAGLPGGGGGFRGVVTRLHRIAITAERTSEQTAEGDALTEEGDPDGTGPKRDLLGSDAA